jgi:hypothetical protein
VHFEVARLPELLRCLIQGKLQKHFVWVHVVRIRVHSKHLGMPGMPRHLHGGTVQQVVVANLQLVRLRVRSCGEHMPIMFSHRITGQLYGVHDAQLSVVRVRMHRERDSLPGVRAYPDKRWLPVVESAMPVVRLPMHWTGILVRGLLVDWRRKWLHHVDRELHVVRIFVHRWCGRMPFLRLNFLGTQLLPSIGWLPVVWLRVHWQHFFLHKLQSTLEWPVREEHAKLRLVRFRVRRFEQMPRLQIDYDGAELLRIDEEVVHVVRICVHPFVWEMPDVWHVDGSRNVQQLIAELLVVRIWLLANSVLGMLQHNVGSRLPGVVADMPMVRLRMHFWKRRVCGM